jgi:hypothetical protein
LGRHLRGQRRVPGARITGELGSKIRSWFPDVAAHAVSSAVVHAWSSGPGHV